MILRPYKRIKELEGEIRGLEVDYYDYCRLKKEEEERKRKKREELHSPSVLCKGCNNLILTNFGYHCKLDCKCKDRQEIKQ